MPILWGRLTASGLRWRRRRRRERVCCSSTGSAGELPGLVLSGVAVHLKLRVWRRWRLLLLLLLQRVALHLQSIFGTQRPVEEQAGNAHVTSRLSRRVRPHRRSCDREVSVPVLGLGGDGRSASFGVMSRLDRLLVVLGKASVEGIQQRQLGRRDDQLGRTCKPNGMKPFSMIKLIRHFWVTSARLRQKQVRRPFVLLTSCDGARGGMRFSLGRFP